MLLNKTRQASAVFRTLLAGCLLLASHSVSAEQPLTLAEAVDAAQQRSRQLVAEDAAATAAREMAIAAARLPDPVLKASLINLPIDGPDRFSVTRDFMTMRTIGVMQEFTREGKRQARAARFDKAAEVAQAGRLVALARLQQQTAVAWVERLYLDQVVALLREQRIEAQLLVDATEAVYRGGSGSQADIFAARTALAQIDDRIEQSLLDSGSARISLLRWIGEAANRPLAAAPSLVATRLDPQRLERQLERHPQIELLSRQEAAARADAELAQSNKQADWSVELMLSQRGPAYSTMMSLNLAVPLQWDQPNRQNREIGASFALIEKVQAERDEALRELVASTRTGLLGLHSLRQRLAIHDASLIPLAAARIDAALADYRGGSGLLADVLDARRALIETRVERLRLEMAGAAQWARINYLIPSDAGLLAIKEQ